MKSRTLLTATLTLALAGSVAGCRGADDTKDRLSSQTATTDRSTATAAPTAEATPEATTPAATSTGSCKASGTGTTDLKAKPVYTVTKAAPPAVTTNVDIVCGTGAEAKEGTHVVAKYVGVNYADGAEFDSSWKVSPDNTFDFTVGSGVIKGFSVGVTGMRAGGRRQVTIPAADGYGDSGPVPGGTLVFVIDLVSVG